MAERVGESAWFVNTHINPFLYRFYPNRAKELAERLGVDFNHFMEYVYEQRR
jgi:hypothetical protein